jgi:hypothetical protein
MRSGPSPELASSRAALRTSPREQNLPFTMLATGAGLQLFGKNWRAGEGNRIALNMTPTWVAPFPVTAGKQSRAFFSIQLLINNGEVADPIQGGLGFLNQSGRSSQLTDARNLFGLYRLMLTEHCS